MTPLIGFAGYSGSGKTTLLERVIPLLKNHGLRLGLIKHSHHCIDPDKPGKDSYRLRHAGCDQTLLATRDRNMLYFEYRNDDRQEPQLNDCIAQLDHTNLDLILVEGFRDEAIPKIEVHRPSYGKPLLHLNDPNIIAFACDDIQVQSTSCPNLPLNDPSAVADFIVSRLQQEQQITRFCPECGQKSWVMRTAKKFQCLSCQFEYFQNPASAVMAIITCDNEVLLTQRKYAPQASYWDLPGGFVDPNESLETALHREIKEELGITINQGSYIGSYPNQYLYQNTCYATVDATFFIQLKKKPDVIVNDDVMNCAWFPITELPWSTLAFSSNVSALKDALVHRE